MYFPKYASHTQKEIRSFTIVMAVFFAFLASVFAWRSDWAMTNVSWTLVGVGIGFVLAGRVMPKSLKLLYHAWMILAFCLNYVMSRILLSIIFFLVILPISLCLRLMGKDVLECKANNGRSFWWRYQKQAPSDHFERLYTLSEVTRVEERT